MYCALYNDIIMIQQRCELEIHTLTDT